MITVKGYRLIVKPDPVQLESKGGIVLATSEEAKKMEKSGINRGLVISIGDSAWQAFRTLDDNGKERNGRAWVAPGDYVLFSRHAGKFVYDPFDDNKEYLVMNDDDVIAVLEEGCNPDIDGTLQQKAVEQL